jgi:hypothetical protein
MTMEKINEEQSEKERLEKERLEKQGYIPTTLYL